MGSFSIVGDGSENVAQKLNSRCFKLLIPSFNLSKLTMANFSRVEFSRFVSGSEKGKLSRCFVFTSFIKRKIRTFHGVILRRRQRNVRRKRKRKSVKRVKGCCFDNLTSLFFAALVAVAVVVAKALFSLTIFIFQLQF